MNEVVLAEFGQLTDDITIDPHDNIYFKIPGREPGPMTIVAGHKDENSLIIRKIDADGKIWCEPIGGIRPIKYGEGPMDILTENGIIPAVLNVGSTHSSDLSGRIHKAKTAFTTWDMVYLHAKMNAAELAEAGVSIGDRAAISRARKKPVYLREDFVGGYALDDKAAVAIAIMLARRLKDTQPLHDVYIAATSNEEGGCSGAQFISRTLCPDDYIAIEIGPIAEEYPVTMDADPIIMFKDGTFAYDIHLSRELMAAGRHCDLNCQPCLVRSFGSDASLSAKAGLVGRAGCIAFPTENTHGYEVGSLPAMENCVRVLFAHLCGITV